MMMWLKSVEEIERDGRACMAVGSKGSRGQGRGLGPPFRPRFITRDSTSQSNYFVDDPLTTLHIVPVRPLPCATPYIVRRRQDKPSVA